MYYGDHPYYGNSAWHGGYYGNGYDNANHYNNGYNSNGYHANNYNHGYNSSGYHANNYSHNTNVSGNTVNVNNANRQNASAIVATPPLPHADGETAEAVAGRRPSVALEITPAALAVAAGAIGRQARAVGEVAAVAEVGAAAVAASAVVGSAVVVAGGEVQRDFLHMRLC